jgi:hypothetical protein
MWALAAMKRMSYSVSLGSATNSLADTAARHTCVYRVCTDMYNSLVDPNQVIANKGDYRACKTEIALSIGKAFNEELGISPVMARKGPAPVITNVAPFSNNRPDDLMSWYIKWYDCRSIDEQVAHRATTCSVKSQSYYPSELNFAGFVMSDAQGHPINGDTAVTIFVGGIITVRNGRFPITAGERVQWYFEEEAVAGVFDDAGNRKPRDSSAVATGPLDHQTQKICNHPYGERAQTKRPVFVKGCRPGIMGGSCTLLDEARCFGDAKLDAGPFQLVDLKVGAQSL